MKHPNDANLSITTPEHWPNKALKILKSKNVDVKELEHTFKHITFPWNDKYNTERTYFSLRIQERPLFIIKPTSISEIETILNYVNSKNLTIRIMNGRHSSGLMYSEVLIDMSGFTNKKLKHDKLIVGAGNTQGMLNDFLFNLHGVEHYSHFGAFTHPRTDTEAFPGGSAASVGVAGISTAGGIGTLCRTYSLTVDHILSFKITLCPTNTHNSSKTVTASKHENSDLFWALRGGVGSNFGIITEITYKIIEVPSIITYSITWKWDQATDVLNQWLQTSPNRPYYFNEDIILYHNPKTTKHGIELSGIYVNLHKQSTSSIHKEIHEQLDSLGGTLKIDHKVKYSNLYKTLVKDRVYHNFSIIQPLFTNKLCPKSLVKMLNEAGKLTGNVNINITLIGGKINETSSKHTAFYPRHKNFFVDIATSWENLHESQSMEKWTNHVIKKLININDTYAYVGFPLTFTNIVQPNTIYYGKNYHRLQKIKKQYDPLNILTHCGTISP